MLHSVRLIKYNNLSSVFSKPIIYLLWFGPFLSNVVYSPFNSYFNSLLKFNINP